jgi:hypothetical protein
MKDRDWGSGVIVWNPHTGTQIHRLIRTTANGGTPALRQPGRKCREYPTSRDAV